MQLLVLPPYRDTSSYVLYLRGCAPQCTENLHADDRCADLIRRQLLATVGEGIHWLYQV